MSLKTCGMMSLSGRTRSARFAPATAPGMPQTTLLELS